MQLSEALDQIDGMIDLVNACIQKNQPELTEQAVTQLRQGMEAFAGLAPRFGQEQFTEQNVARMQALSQRMTQMRCHMAKMTAMTSQQLATLLPEQSMNFTYGGSSKPGAAASVARMYHISG